MRMFKNTSNKLNAWQNHIDTCRKDILPSIEDYCFVARIACASFSNTIALYSWPVCL
jgi:hypothetical protein